LTLERKIANWIELGIMPYSETMTLQDKLVNMRKKDLIPDTILSVQHPLTVSFGADKKNNKFSQMLLFLRALP
jgi:lipoate-protein ligase B